MRKWFGDLLQRNRGEGPKPSGVCLWQDVIGLNRLVNEVADQVLEQDDDWEALGRQLAQPSSDPQRVG